MRSRITYGPVWLLVSLTVLGVLLCRAPAQPPVRMYVFARVGVTSQALRERLRQALPSLQVAVFGRLRDFRRAVSTGRPDLVMDRAPLLDDLGLASHIQGFARGAPTERYVLVTRDRPLLDEELPHSKLGIVDLLGAEGMEKLATELLGGIRPGTVRRVPNPADLLALLRLDLAAGVLLPQRQLNDLKIGSEMSVAVRPLAHAGVGLYAVHLLDPERRDEWLSRFRKLDASLYRLMGVDEWR